MEATDGHLHGRAMQKGQAELGSQRGPGDPQPSRQQSRCAPPGSHATNRCPPRLENKRAS